MSIRIFIRPEDISKREKIRLAADKSHYLISVMRCREGDPVSILDGAGKAYEAVIAEISGKKVFATITSEIPIDSESPLNLVLCQGILKGEKMDLVIQKATELGVKEIVPLITERVVVRETRKTKRWLKIAEETVEQCGRAVIPAFHEPVSFRNFLKDIGPGVNGFIFWEEGGFPLNEAIRKISPISVSLPLYIIIGPEGGFSAAEVKAAEDNGLIRTTLGKRILRAETAAIASVALVEHLIGSASDDNL